MKQFSFLVFRFSFINFRKTLIFALFLMFAACYPTGGAFAQENDSRDTAPPPLKILSKDEIKQLEAVTDVKKRTNLALDLMEIRLKKAETLNSQQQYVEMFNEFGGFHALVDKTLEFLDRNSSDRKNLNSYKRLEISLRMFLPRLELIRRDLPTNYEFYVRDLAKSIRQARSKAIEPFFGEGVVRENED